MITWMQRHKKWLIITIWISTIAFIGAGFVGWGSYDYGKSNSTVAIVGDKEVPLTDLQDEYSRLYGQYQQILGPQFNQEVAKRLNLENIAFSQVINKYLLLQFADELHLAVTDDEVARELLTIPAFFKDGKFDKNVYMKVLKQNRQTIASFEARLKKDLLVQKVQKIFSTTLDKNELKALSKLFYETDKVSIALINSSDIKVYPTQKELKAFYDKTKENYKSPFGYKIAFVKVENISGNTKKQMKKVALKKYLNLKKGKESFTDEKVIYDDMNFLNQEQFDKMKKSAISSVMKPLYINDTFYIIKKLETIKPQVLPYDKIKDIVKESYIASKKKEIIESKIANLEKNFKGKSLGYISRDSKPTIENLNDVEIDQLIKAIFNTNQKIDSVKLADKAIVFKIEDTKFGKYDKANDTVIGSVAKSLKDNIIVENLIKQLKAKYEIKSFMGSN